MKYSTNSVQISFSVALADFLRANGYDIYWHESGVTEAQTAGLAQAKAVIEFVDEIPANAALIVRLKSGSVAEEVAVPVVSVSVESTPRRIRGLGLGHKEMEWDRSFRIEALAADKFQWKELADLFHDFIENEDEGREHVIYDFDTDPANPVALDPVTIVGSSVVRHPVVHEVETVRYYIVGIATINYAE